MLILRGFLRRFRRHWLCIYSVNISSQSCLLQNRLEESLKLFRSICNNRFFTDTCFVSCLTISYLLRSLFMACCIPDVATEQNCCHVLLIFCLKNKTFTILIFFFVCFTFQILFLNKVDLFRDKILHSKRPLRKYFQDYPGKNRFDQLYHRPGCTIVLMKWSMVKNLWLSVKHWNRLNQFEELLLEKRLLSVAELYWIKHKLHFKIFLVVLCYCI